MAKNDRRECANASPDALRQDAVEQGSSPAGARPPWLRWLLVFAALALAMAAVPPRSRMAWLLQPHGLAVAAWTGCCSREDWLLQPLRLRAVCALRLPHHGELNAAKRL